METEEKYGSKEEFHKDKAHFHFQWHETVSENW